MMSLNDFYAECVLPTSTVPTISFSIIIRNIETEETVFDGRAWIDPTTKKITHVHEHFCTHETSDECVPPCKPFQMLTPYWTRGALFATVFHECGIIMGGAEEHDQNLWARVA